MQNLIKRYKEEIERYSIIISDKNSTKEKVKDANYFKSKAKSYLEEIKKGKLKLS